MKKIFLISLIFILMFTAGCNKTTNEKIPENFNFSLTWGVYGESSYDSSTGKLVKTTNATNPDDYVIDVILSEEELTEIRNLLNNLNIDDYLDTYDPFNDPNSDDKIMSTPSQTLILIVNSASINKTISCKDIALHSSGYNAAAQDFIDAVERIEEILTETEEWKSLPDYEFYYD